MTIFDSQIKIRVAFSSPMPFMDEKIHLSYYEWSGYQHPSSLHNETILISFRNINLVLSWLVPWFHLIKPSTLIISNWSGQERQYYHHKSPYQSCINTYKYFCLFWFDELWFVYLSPFWQGKFTYQYETVANLYDLSDIIS